MSCLRQRWGLGCLAVLIVLLDMFRIIATLAHNGKFLAFVRVTFGPWMATQTLFSVLISVQMAASLSPAPR